MTGANAPNASRVRSAHRERTPPRAWSGADSKPMAHGRLHGSVVPRRRYRDHRRADAVVAVVYASSEIAPPGQGHLQGIVGQLDRCVGPYGPAHNLPRPYVYLERQVQPGLPKLGIDNVCEPRPVGPGQVGGHARTGLCHARRGSAGSVRVYRGYIHRARIHTVLGNLSPAEFE